MPAVTIKIKGLAELSRAFDKGADALDKSFNVFVKKATLTILARTRPLTPVDTGFLRGPAMVTDFRPGRGRIQNRAPYAFFVHEGTRFMRARPFFDQGIAQARTELASLLRDAIDIPLSVIAKT